MGGGRHGRPPTPAGHRAWTHTWSQIRTPPAPNARPCITRHFTELIPAVPWPGVRSRSGWNERSVGAHPEATHARHRLSPHRGTRGHRRFAHGSTHRDQRHHRLVLPRALRQPLGVRQPARRRTRRSIPHPLSRLPHQAALPTGLQRGDDPFPRAAGRRGGRRLHGPGRQRRHRSTARNRPPGSGRPRASRVLAALPPTLRLRTHTTHSDNRRRSGSGVRLPCRYPHATHLCTSCARRRGRHLDIRAGHRRKRGCRPGMEHPHPTARGRRGGPPVQPHPGLLAELAAPQPVSRPLAGNGEPLSARSQTAGVPADRCAGRRADHIAAGRTRRHPQLGLSLHLDPRRRVHHIRADDARVHRRGRRLHGLAGTALPRSPGR